MRQYVHDDTRSYYYQYQSNLKQDLLVPDP